MKNHLKSLKLLLLSILVLQITSCSSDSSDDPKLPDPVNEIPKEPEEPDNGGNDNPDTDNDGIVDSEDADDDNDGLIEVFTIDGLEALRTNLSTSGKQLKGLSKNNVIGFELVKDLDFDNVDDYDDSSLLPTYTSGLGWTPIGTTEFNETNTLTQENRFLGIFEGNGYTIRNLFINRPEEDYIGLFGACNNDAIIRNLNLEIKEITGERILGGLAGLGSGSIENVTVSGNITSTSTGQAMMGLLVGLFEGGTISNCATFGSAEAPNGIMVGGLLGRLVIPPASDINASIIRCYADVEVVGRASIGGLAGSFSLEDADAIIKIENSYAIGNVSGENQTGGLIGKTLGSTITNCYATGSITNTGDSQFDGDSGGLIGFAFSVNIASCYATGDVLGNNLGECRGGLVGFIHSTIIETSYSTGRVEGIPSEIGGLTGRCQAATPSTIPNTNYWDREKSGLSFSLGDAQGLMTLELQSPTNASGIYADWDSNVWDFGTTSEYPVLKDMPNGIETQR